ncbi:PRC-barrel domain-containing protein [Krasilnikovia sp. MM14-A1004]|uniref:PRC-barrel domain-containing protein n=1 Tax=Krasilnikovia sp. MM14-A1004 TaxID=3373541 RepID=UPI00399CA970
MSPEPRTVRASDLLGRRVHDDRGRPLGAVADLITETGPDGTQRVTAVLVVQRPWGRLLGYERDEITGPPIVNRLARHILRRNQTVVPFAKSGLDRPGAT